LLSSKQADFQQHRLLMENQIIYTTQEIDWRCFPRQEKNII
jgi:hypothetical protein